MLRNAQGSLPYLEVASVRRPKLINCLGRLVGTRLRGVKGIDRLLRTLHHPDKRAIWYFETVASAVPSGPKYHIESRWFTEWTTYFYGSQDDAIHEWIQNNAQPDWIAFDIGMNFGYFACLLGQRCREVHGFEPVPWLAERALANVRLNNLCNVRINSVALAECPGAAKLKLPSRHDANWGTSSLAHQSSSSEELDVPTNTIDEYARNTDLRRLDFIKLDVEGAEALVLSGGSEVLKRFRPTVVFERNVESFTDALALLGDVGYTFHSLTGRRLDHKPLREWPCDILAYYK